MNFCDGCHLVFRYTTLKAANEYGNLCPSCYQKWLKGEPPFDE
jgi:hypothetical protein